MHPKYTQLNLTTRTLFPQRTCVLVT